MTLSLYVPVYVFSKCVCPRIDVPVCMRILILISVLVRVYELVFLGTVLCVSKMCVCQWSICTSGKCLSVHLLF